MDTYLDLIIPRGGASLIEAVVSMARMPVIKHYDGICHVFVDKGRRPRHGRSDHVNSKLQKPSVCNALETLLIHRDIAATFVPRIAEVLSAKKVELRGDETFIQARRSRMSVIPATEEDWKTEYLDYILAMKIVDDLDAAIAHINHYGSHHTDSIVTRMPRPPPLPARSRQRLRLLELLDPLRRRGRVRLRRRDRNQHRQTPRPRTDGLEELCSYKYLVNGSGQVK
jgi:glutamate-5-semialdehyde dehydrogenase